MFDNITGMELLSGVLTISSVFGIIYSIAKFTVNCNKQQILLDKLEKNVDSLTGSINSIYKQFSEVEVLKRNIHQNTELTVILYSAILEIIDERFCEDGTSKQRLLDLKYNLNDTLVSIYKENQ